MKVKCSYCGDERDGLKPGEFIICKISCPKRAKNLICDYLPVKDKINPDHYKVGGIETFDYIKAKLSPSQLDGFCKGNIIKYVSRADHKNKIEDLKKAKWYLDNLIKIIEETKHE